MLQEKTKRPAAIKKKKKTTNTKKNQTWKVAPKETEQSQRNIHIF